ncbi:ATP-binding protein [Lagierella sp.]|uniref:ATP-binding protein n=1 Tax=Lagierella sp. TaxID=2849657 RepID=UPI00262ACE65|nr:ATP-binding protein [Lagierella sp.]
MDIKIIGMTDQQEAYVGSNDRKFRINEFLMIEDSFGDILGEVVEVHSYNRYITVPKEGGVLDSDLIDNLVALGFNLEEDTIYVGKIRLLEESTYAIETGSSCRVPSFDEVKKYFMSSSLDKGMNVGVIRNTDDIFQTGPEKLKNICYTLEDGEFREQRELPYILNLYGMHHYPHIGIFGGSGSGKSYGLRVLIEELMNKDVPGIILDPHYEMDFTLRSKKDYGPDYNNKFSKFVIGENTGVDFTKISTRELKALISTSSRLTEGMESVIEVLHKYNDSVLSFSNRLNYLIEAQKIGSPERIRQMAAEVSGDEKKRYEIMFQIYNKYNDKCPPSSVQGVSWRFNRLNNLGIFEHDSKLVFDCLKMGKIAVIQGSVKIIQVYSTYIISSLYDLRRSYKDSIIKNETMDYFPPFFVITDEAHNFAPQSFDGNGDLSSKYILREIAQEGRKYGVFLILATQRPSLLDNTITAQLNTKFIYRTTRSTDIQTIKEETDLSVEQTNRLPYLKTGDVFLSESAIGRTMYVRIRASHTLTPHGENPFEELVNRQDEDVSAIINMLKNYLPINELDIMDTCKEIQEDEGVVYSVEQFTNLLEDFVTKGYLNKEKGLLVKYILNE